MRPFPLSLASLVALALACSRGSTTESATPVSSISPVTSASYAEPQPPFAVLEVFSSEGCSSCPPAERAADALAERTPGLFVLSFHVDYWDYLGHRDPYASAAATKRQADYGHSLYTPMLVLDGEELRGGTSDLGNAVARAVRPGTTRLRVRVPDANASPLVVELGTEGEPAKRILVAAVEHGLVQRPAHGENAGTTLRHDNVTRAWTEVPGATSRVTLDVPSDAKRDALRVVAVAFDDRSPARMSGAAAWPKAEDEGR